MQLATQKQFAEIIGRSEGRVSQMIKAGQIHGAALVGTGRNRRIAVDVAKEQLASALDFGQMLAQPQIEAPSAPLEANTPQTPAPDDHQARYNKARADSAEITAAQARRKEELERGVYILVADAEKAWTRELSLLLEGVDRFVEELAVDLAAQPLSAREAKARARQKWRDHRARSSADRMGAAAERPETVVDETQQATPH